MGNWDVIIIGGGIIGLALSIELRKREARVLVVERGEPGREASQAAGGMLVDCSSETPPALQSLATASARMYPEFVHELQIASGVNVDLRNHGAIVLFSPDHAQASQAANAARSLPLLSVQVSEVEPALADFNGTAFLVTEGSVDPRALTESALITAKHRGVNVSSGEEVTRVEITDGHVRGVVTRKTFFPASKVVNCAGAWSGQIAPHAFPTRPVKGQMLGLLSPSRELLKHVIRAPEAYLIPRSDGRIIVGTTVEEAGFDKRTNDAAIQRLHRAAIDLVPDLRHAKILEDWAGLRPGTPDALPILGATSTPGYYVATGHFRDGILLAPITATIMAQVVEGKDSGHDLSAFDPARFSL